MEKVSCGHESLLPDERSLQSRVGGQSRTDRCDVSESVIEGGEGSSEVGV